MGFLNPVLLALAAGVAVPLLLHLLHRSEGRRVPFPALRYLLRTEKDHARRIRTRQLLLLVLRMAILVLAALAGARMLVRGAGPAHPPTAVAVILDNSLSSGRVVGEGRVLETLKAAALEALAQAGPDDRFWIIRAGEPWDVATPLAADQAAARVRDTRVTGATGDLDAALARARGLVGDAELAAAEIHLLSDLQASAFSSRPPDLAGVPVVVYTGVQPPGANRYVQAVSVGGGLPPRANRRTEVAVSVGGAAGDGEPVPVRVFLAGQLRGASSTPVEGTAVLPAGPFPQGRLEGYAETDPDELRADDRFYVSLTVEPPPAVGVVGDPGRFLRDALAVLEESGRIRLEDPAQSEILVLEWGEGLDRLREGGRAVVVPGADPALGTALDRRLREAGISARMESGVGGWSRIARDGTGIGLEGVRVQRVRRLAADGDDVTVWATLEDRDPWLLEARGGLGSVMLLGSRLEPDETSLPLEAAMVPLVEWLLSGSGSGPSVRRVEAGDRLSLPAAATAVEDPAGARVPVDGTREYRFTGEPGIYTVLGDDQVLDRVAVNAPLAESRLEPLEEAELEARLESGAPTLAATSAQWANRVFTTRRGLEIWRPLLAAVLLLLVAESWVAASGGSAGRRGSMTSGSRGGARVRIP
jgi:hypothetical protein